MPRNPRAMRAAQPILPLVTASLVAMLALPALAAPVTVGFRGTFTSVLDPMGALPGGIVQGAEFSGSYALDADLFVLSPDGFTNGYIDVFEGYFYSVRYFVPGEGASITLQLGSEAFAFSVSVVRIYESHTYSAERGGDGAVVGWFLTYGDEWQISTEPVAAPGSSVGLALVYESSSGYRTESRTASDPLSPPPVVISLDGWREGGRIHLFDPSDPSSYSATGELTDVFVVPEPSTALLLGLGLLSGAG